MTFEPRLNIASMPTADRKGTRGTRAESRWSCPAKVNRVDALELPAEALEYERRRRGRAGGLPCGWRRAAISRGHPCARGPAGSSERRAFEKVSPGRWSIRSYGLIGPE